MPQSLTGQFCIICPHSQASLFSELKKIQLLILYLCVTNQNAMRRIKRLFQSSDLLLNKVVIDPIIGIMKHSFIHLKLCEHFPESLWHFFPLVY